MASMLAERKNYDGFLYGVCTLFQRRVETQIIIQNLKKDPRW